METTGFITFESLSQTGMVRHCFSTRQGGCSEPPFDSMNLGFSRGDKREAVLENYRRLAERVGFDTKDMVFSHQVHGVEIKNVDNRDKGSLPDNNHLQSIDGLITNKKNVVLVTFYADCVPIFLLDPVEKVIGLSHAGWRGTVTGIAGLTVEKMRYNYGCEPKNILAVIGPSIGKCCFEVDEPVAAEFLKIPEGVAHVHKGRENKSQIDLWQVNKNILEKAGVLPEKIEISGLCTKCNEELFYSHRRTSHRGMDGQRGSMAAFLELC